MQRLKNEDHISTDYMTHNYSGITTSDIRDVFHSWHMQPAHYSSVSQVTVPQVNTTNTNTILNHFNLVPIPERRFHCTYFIMLIPPIFVLMVTFQDIPLCQISYRFLVSVIESTYPVHYDLHLTVTTKLDYLYTLQLLGTYTLLKLQIIKKNKLHMHYKPDSMLVRLIRLLVATVTTHS